MFFFFFLTFHLTLNSKNYTAQAYIYLCRFKGFSTFLEEWYHDIYIQIHLD